MKRVENTEGLAWGQGFTGLKLKDLSSLFKLRLSLTVVFSAVIGFLLPATAWSIEALLILIAGGFAVTASANAINQLIEKDLDKLMHRTKNRPLPAQRMQVKEASLWAGVMGVFGIILLSYTFGALCGLIAAVSLLSYGFIYTPLKRFSNVAVLVGAFPGALPPVIGYVAAVGGIDFWAILIFSIQFMWQFPHFWAIAWVADKDYTRAGFYLMPAVQGPGKRSAVWILAYTLVLVAVSLLPYIYGLASFSYLWIAILAGGLFLVQSLKLLIKTDDQSAKQLMFGSFFYLPIILIALLLG